MKIVLGVVPDVGDMDRTSRENRSTAGMSLVWRQWVGASYGIGAFDRRVVDRFQTNQVAPIGENRAGVGLAQSPRVPHDGVENRPRVRGRVADQAQDFAGGDLRVQR